MPVSWTESVYRFLYGSAATFGSLEVVLRTVVVYIAAIAIVRLGKKKFMGQHTGFDTLIAFILGSVLSRGINGSSPLPQTLVSGVALVGLHWLLTLAAIRFAPLGRLMNGHVCQIVKDGIVDKRAMYDHGVSLEDLEEALRTNGKTDKLTDVSAAFLERSGRISVLTAPKGPTIIELPVRDGVQRIVIELVDKS